MRILIISPYWPWPLDSGGSVAQFGWIDYLRHRHEITLLSPAISAANLAAAEKLRELWPEVKIAPVVPPHLGEKPTPLQTIKAFVRELPLIKPVYHSLARKLQAPVVGSGQLATLPEFLVRAAAEEARRSYDLFQVEYVEMLSMIHVLPPEVPALFAHIEIHYVIRDRGRDEASRRNVYDDYIFAQEKAKELDTLRRYDAIATMSEHDRKVLQAELPGCEIEASPFAYIHPPGQQAEFELSPFADKITYIGGSKHPPNVFAVRWFLEGMWPALLAQFPTLKFYIIGEWALPFRQEFGREPGVVFAGYVEEVAPLLHGSIMVVPLQIGSGIRTKILMAMTLGVPVVTTSVGVEGIDVDPGREVACADTPESFVAAVAGLIRNPLANDQMARNAHRFVQDKYSVESAGARRDAIYGRMHARHQARAQRNSSPAS